MRWTQHDSRGFFQTDPVDESSSLTGPPKSERWIPPTTWRVAASLGFTYTLADVVTFHLAVSASHTALAAGDFVKPSWENQDGNFAIGVGSVQSIGLRPLPLIRIHLRDWVALNVSAAVRFFPAQQSIEESYLAGASFVW
jgi:hypothetical protein